MIIRIIFFWVLKLEGLEHYITKGKEFDLILQAILSEPLFNIDMNLTFKD